MKLQDWLLCAGFAVALPSGQMLFKYAAIFHERSREPVLLLRVLQNLPLWGAFTWYGITALFWFYILTRIPLSTAYTCSILGSALVPLMAWVVFKEPLGPRFLLGYALMMTGFLVIMRSPA
jgi:multidrug transporter EmrE-like cation transporter